MVQKIYNGVTILGSGWFCLFNITKDYNWLLLVLFIVVPKYIFKYLFNNKLDSYYNNKTFRSGRPHCHSLYCNRSLCWSRYILYMECKVKTLSTASLQSFSVSKAGSVRMWSQQWAGRTASLHQWTWSPSPAGWTASLRWSAGGWRSPASP